MDADYFLVFGLIVAALAIPSIIGAFSADRSFRTAIVLLSVGSAMVAWAALQKPGGYSGDEIPRVFVRVFTDLLS